MTTGGGESAAGIREFTNICTHVQDRVPGQEHPVRDDYCFSRLRSTYCMIPPLR